MSDIITQKQVAESSNALGFDLWSRLRPGVNLALSPISVSSALAMLYGGARGDTAAQIAKVMHIDMSPDDAMRSFGYMTYALTGSWDIQLKITNRLFGEETYGFHHEFIDKTQEAFRAGLESMDFINNAEQSRNIINEWVSRETDHLIKDLLPPESIDKDTRLVLANAIYFLADWQNRFEEKHTKTQPFKLLNGESTAVSMMNMRRTRRMYGDTGEVRLLQLPYKGELSALIVLPTKDNGIGEIEKSLTPGKLQVWGKYLRNAEIDIQLPRFELSPETENLTNPLRDLGMVNAFEDFADFTGIAPKPDDDNAIRASAVYSKSFIKTNEDGTEAAAAAAVTMSRSASMNVEFKADHPFLFIVQDDPTGAVVFMARVTNPNEK